MDVEVNCVDRERQNTLPLGSQLYKRQLSFKKKRILHMLRDISLIVTNIFAQMLAILLTKKGCLRSAQLLHKN